MNLAAGDATWARAGLAALGFMHEAAMHVVRYPGPLRSFYLKQKRRKGNKIARVAVARKLCTYIYHMLKEGKDFSSILSYTKSDLG